MSDPVTHAEIEDVLSSIRRLVSEDTRGQPAAPAPAARLVLTPALRVQAPAPAGGSAEGAEASEAPDLQPAEEPALAAEADAGAGSTGEEALGAGPVRAEDREDMTHPLAEDPPLAFRHRWDLAGSRADGRPQDDAARAGGMENCLDDAGAGAPWSNPETTLFAAVAGAAGHAADCGTEDEAADAAPVRLADDRLAASTAGARAASVVRKIAELEARSSAAQGAVQEHWEPDSQTEAPFAGAGPDTIEWRDEPLTLSDEDEPEDEPESLMAEDAQPAADMPDAEAVIEAAVTGAAMDTLADSSEGYLDEDALRDLVAAIVREELQGPLGERITRNVRKLVRREIHRALAAHDLV